MKTTLKLLFVSLVLFACTREELRIKVTNNLDFERANETVFVKKSQLPNEKQQVFNKLCVVDSETGEMLISQKVDVDGDNNPDVLLFQPKVKANSVKVYTLNVCKEEDSIESKVFSRFVPERTDDYAWENDRVAFRTFGPTAQKMIEDSVPGGTLTSGIDCWMKTVDYPIINKWYKMAMDEPNYYHVDHGEGLDAYHVGTSRGCGGIGYFNGDKLFVSKNFTSYKTMANGPVRTCFTLQYADWNAEGNQVKESKHISLDLGSNLTRVIDSITGVDTITVGLTLHDKKGVVSVDTANLTFSYWEPLAESEMGVGVVVSPEYYAGYTEFISDKPDESQLFIHIKVINGKAVYYTGFGFKKSGQFNSFDDWKSYLRQFSSELRSPLKVEISK